MAHFRAEVSQNDAREPVIPGAETSSASFPQEHWPKQKADTDHKNGNCRGCHGKKHPRAEIFADHSNQDHQPAELDNLWTS